MYSISIELVFMFIIIIIMRRILLINDTQLNLSCMDMSMMKVLSFCDCCIIVLYCNYNQNID
jgi:hypothetical protein